MAQFFEYTDSGIRFKGFQDLRKTLVEAWEATFGSEIDSSPTSPDGHHIDLEAATINSVAEMIQAVANTMNRNQATGEYLDLLAAFLGLERLDGETDEELRTRMDKASVFGFATLDGMTTFLQNALGSSVVVKVNDEPVQDADGIPGHSFRVVVPSSVYSDLQGRAESGEIDGADDYIAQMTWTCKPAGIKSDGNLSGFAVDKSGQKHQVNFSVPTNVEIEVQVILSLYDEETFPDNGEEMVHDAIIDWSTGNGTWVKAEYTAGKDVIPARFYVPILSVPGISSAELKVRKAGYSTWTSNNIGINSQEIATLSQVDVSVAVANG